MKDVKIKKIEFLYRNQPKRRKIKVTLTDGSRTYIESCHEAWQQYGNVTDNLWLTVGLADKYNDWLHGIGDKKSGAIGFALGYKCLTL
jgi:hypothetical protein